MSGAPLSHNARWQRVRTLLLQVSKQQLTVGAGIGVARIAGFLTGAVAARSLKPSGFALYTVGFTAFSALMQLTSFADTWLVSRWNNESYRAEIMGTVWRIKTVVGATLVTIAVIVSAWVPSSLTTLGIDPWTFTIGVAAAACAALTTALASKFQAERRFLPYTIVLVACPCLGLVATLTLAAVRVHTPTWYLACILASYIPTAWLARMTLRTRTGSSPIRASLFREALHFGGWVTIGSLAFVAFQRLDVFLLTALHPGPEVGTYGVATRFAAMAAVFGSTITAVLMPMGSNQSTWSARESRRSYVIESVLSVGLTVTAITLGILATPMLVGSLFGSEYAAAVEPARVLLLAQIVLIAQMPFYFGFYALKGERWIAGLGVSQVIVSALAGYWLIGKHGIAGAAWSNVITYAIGLAVVTVFHITRMSRSTLRAWT